MRRSMSLLRGQKTAQMPQVQFTEKLVDGAVLMRRSPTAHSRDVSDSAAVQQSGEHSSSVTQSTEKDADCQEGPVDC